MFTGVFGGALGNMDPVLNTPFAAVLALAVLLLMLALRKPGIASHVRRAAGLDLVYLPDVPGGADVFPCCWRRGRL